MTAKTMAEVLREELRKGTYQMPHDSLPYETKAADIAAALTAAGFGLVADAWDEGQKSGMRHADRVIAAHKIGRPELPGPPSPNPYRAG